ncbi:MAG: ABC transporter permease [Acidobacteria bacterium]|nr:ABC transporter permease [Acidobacteriota bacterium]
MASGITAYQLPPNPLHARQSAPPRGESYWDLVLRQYRRNRLAVASLFFVLALFLIAIAAPFLADNKPIVFHGAYRGLYRQVFDEWRMGGHPELVAALEATPSQDTTAAAPLPARLATVERQLTRLASQLPAEQAQSLQGYLQSYRDAIPTSPATGSSARSSPPSTSPEQTLRQNFQEISEKFAIERVTLQQQLYWPVFTALGSRDIFFLTLAALLLLLLALRRMLPTPLRESGRAQLLLVVLPPVFLAALWSRRPQVFDTLDYKQQLFDGEIEHTLALFPPIPYGINEDHLEDKFQGPSSRHWIGTDGNGRDLLTRMIWGSRISLSVGFVAVAIYVAIGILVGTLAGYFRGWVDMTLSRVIEIMICFPAFFLILAVLAFLQPSMWNIMVVIGITGWTTEARLVRGEFLRLADQEFVLAARGLGVTDGRIIFRHVLPNGLAPLLVAASFGIASAILIESSLSFLGFGISIPIPSWGGILNEARESFRYWWITIFPGLAIFSTVTAYNLIGEGIRDAIDPRLKL